jgi:flagellar biosynthesis chaperone FliJ
VIDGGAYAGESLMETLTTGDKRLVSYAVDLGTRVTTAFGSDSNLLREFRFRRGILTTRTAMRETRTFTIRNVDNRAKTVIVETPVRPDYKLVSSAPAETTANTRRFEVKLAAGATEKFPMVKERVIENAIAVANLTPDVLYSYVRNNNLDEAARKKIEPLAALKRDVANLQRDVQLTEKQISDLSQDQSRLRQNISSLGSVSGQQQRVQEYAQRLAALESQLATLRDQQSALLKKKSALEQQLNDMMEKLEI